MEMLKKRKHQGLHTFSERGGMTSATYYRGGNRRGSGKTRVRMLLSDTREGKCYKRMQEEAKDRVGNVQLTPI